MTFQQYNALLKASAIRYRYVFGFSVIPISQNTKVPAISWKRFTKELASADQICAWFKESPGCGIGIVCGEISGNLVVVDVDTKKSDAGSRFVAENDLVSNVAASTPSGGFHYYFKADRKVPTILSFKNGLDVKSESSYILAPPTVMQNPSGSQYKWITECALTPENLPKAFPIVETIERAYKETPIVDNGTQWVSKVLEEGVQEGARNMTMTRIVAYYLAKGFAGDALWPIVEDANSRFFPPLKKNELSSIVASMSKRHSREMALAY